MRLVLIAFAAAGALLAGPVLAAVIAPEAVTQVAERGVAVQHHHFTFDKAFKVRAQGELYRVHVQDADAYELPLTTQVVVRGDVSPAPSDEQVRQAVQLALERAQLPLLAHDVQRSGEAITIQATLPAGVLAELSPQYRALLAQYEDR